MLSTDERGNLRCYKPERSQLRAHLTDLALSLNAGILCMKKAVKYETWIKRGFSGAPEKQMPRSRNPGVCLGGYEAWMVVDNLLRLTILGRLCWLALLMMTISCISQ
eukprot:Skav229979  [mRNA]  locus=scaffold372:541204:547384:+ [translate_table: standard]